MAKVYILFLLLCGFAHADQVNCVKWKNADGSTLGTYCKPFSIKAGTGVYFTDDPLGRILTINATGSGGGAGNPGGADTQGQINDGGVFYGDSGFTYNKSTHTLTATHITGLDNRPYLDAVRDCGASGNGAGLVDDGATINTCTINNPGKTIFFPDTQAGTACDYYSTVSLVPYGSFIGAGSTWPNNGPLQLQNTSICFPSGVTGINLQLTQCRGSCFYRDFGLVGGDFFGNLQTPTKFIVPQASALTDYNRTINTIQRTANVTTVTVNGINGVGEKLFQQVGSTVAITGVAGDATLNGLCVISALSGLSAYGDNPSTFTCPQTGADAGPFVSDGTVKLPTTGTAVSDGIRVCGNFYQFAHITVMGFARWGINADANAGEGCTNAFADDLTVLDSIIVNNQVGGFFTRGTDSSVDLFSGNSFYYNGIGAVDGSALGNTWINNNFSNNGVQWATGSTPATKNITSVNRVSSTVSVVLASADTNIKVGSCVVIAGVTDASFNNTAGQCYIVTTSTDTTHYAYIQPGNPGDASSSGGTSRYAKFSETYLSTGLDSGSYKMGVDSSGSSQSLLLNNYIEGGQPCKLGYAVLAIQGANTPCALVAGSFTGSFIGTQYFAVGELSSNLKHLGNKDDGSGYELTFHAGLTSNVNSNIEYLTWDTYNNVRAWRLAVQTTGTAGANGQWCLSSDGTNQTRLCLFGSNNGGNSYINGTGTGEISINRGFAGTAGSGGACVYDGSSSVKYGCLKSTGFIPGTAAGQSLGTVALPFSSAIIGGAANTTAQIKCTACTGNRVLEIVGDTNGSLSTYLSASDAAVDLASVASAACTSERSVAVAGAAFGNPVEVMAGTSLEDGTFLKGHVISAGNIKWALCNLSGGAVDRASDTYSIRVVK